MNLPAQYQTPVADASEYQHYALNLLAGRGFINNDTGLPTSRRPPLYPLFLAFIYYIFGVNYFAVRFIQSIISAFLCIVIYYIAKKAFDQKVALVSAAMLVFYQPHIYYLYFGGPGFLLSETLFTLLLTLTIFFLSMSFSEHAYIDQKNIILAGFFLGLASLTRPEVALFPLFLVFLFLAKNKFQNRLIIKKIALFSLVFILSILPWMIRNYLVQKAPVPLTTLGGYIFWSGNNPTSRGGWGRDFPKFDKIDHEQLSLLSEAKIDRLFYKAGIEFLIKNYKLIPKLFLKKLLVFWNIFNEFGSYNFYYGIIFMFALLNIIFLLSSKFKCDMNCLLLVIVFIYFNFVALVFFGDPRYRYPIEPFIIIFASAGILGLYENFKNKILSFTAFFFIILINIILNYFVSDIFRLARSILRYTDLSW